MINQNWVFGSRAGLDFSTPIPTAQSGFAIGTFEGCASISDSAGNLLFYTDGSSVWDASHVLQVTGLLGNASSTQSSIIVPDPGNSDRYYIFTADGASGGNNHVNGVRIDLTTWTSTPLSSLMTMPTTAGFSSTEKVLAVQHANCRDFWVMTLLETAAAPVVSGPGTFRLFLVNTMGVQHISDTPLGLNVADLGYLKGSPDGSRIAFANASLSNVLVYDFDNAAGALNLGSLVAIPVPAAGTGNIPVGHPRSPYGVEFSPNGRFLYYSLLGIPNSTAATARGFVFQVDLSVPPVSVEIVNYANPGGVQNRYAVGALQRGQDGRIYIAKDGEASLGAILAPDIAGPGVGGCNPNMSFIALAAGTLCYLGLPNLLPNACGCPCEAGCEEDVNEANAILNDRADDREFVIVANGQTLPAGCSLAFPAIDFAPVFTLHWGDGPSDQFESHDHEVIYIRVNNPYQNIGYRGLTIFDITITPNQTLPDGTDTLRIIPAEIVCFDNIEPCSHVSRDFAFLIDNAIPGPYQISFTYCIDEIVISTIKDGAVTFDVDVVAS